MARANDKCNSFGGGGGRKGVYSDLGCRDTFLKTASLLKNYTSEGGKSIHFGKLSALAVQKYQNHYHRCTGKKLQRPKSRICRDACVFA